MQRLPAYGLARARLVVHQPDDGRLAPEELGQRVRAGILEDLYKRNEEALQSRDAKIALLEGELLRVRQAQGPVTEVVTELSALFPTLRTLQVGGALRVRGAALDSVRVAIVGWQRLPATTERRRVEAFLGTRLRDTTLSVTHIIAPGL